jgi:hypothetical protein
MDAKINPDPHVEGFSPHPKGRVTAVINQVADLASAVRSLNQVGFSDEHISVFAGKEGLARLDLHGEAHGFLARLIRAAESLTTEDRTNSQDIEEGLRSGKFFITVLTDGSEEQKTVVEHLLKAHHAHHLRFFGAWTVEHL